MIDQVYLSSTCTSILSDECRQLHPNFMLLFLTTRLCIHLRALYVKLLDLYLKLESMRLCEGSIFPTIVLPVSLRKWIEIRGKIAACVLKTVYQSQVTLNSCEKTLKHT